MTAVLPAALVFLLSAASPKPEPLPEELRALSKKGMDAIYAVDIAGARSAFTEALRKYPDHPFPRFGIAMTEWANYEYLEEEADPAAAKKYKELTDKAITVGKKWIAGHPHDANAFLCLGGMYGLRAWLDVLQHHWFSAYFAGRKALALTRKSLKIDPGLYDAYLGLGMYEYEAGTLPGVIKLLARLVMRGDAKKGITYLTLCKDKGFYNSLAAKLLLIDIYTQHGGKYANPELALKWARELRAAYPGKPNAQFIEIVALYECARYDEAGKETLDYLHSIEAGKAGFLKSFLPRVYNTLGDISLATRDYDKAAEYFSEAAASLKEAPEHPPARWAVWGLVQLGNVYDLKGMREQAVRTYRAADDYKDEWGLAETTEHYIKTPFSETQLPAPIPPP